MGNALMTSKAHSLCLLGVAKDWLEGFGELIRPIRSVDSSPVGLLHQFGESPALGKNDGDSRGKSFHDV